jgi:uncharacterized protein (TIGR04255 family)
MGSDAIRWIVGEGAGQEASAERALPDFEDPPVVETALGVEFEPIPSWEMPHFGLYWSTIRPEFPIAEVQPPLSSQIESYGPPEPRPPFSVEFDRPGHARCWFMDQTKGQLIQVQDTRFIVNWRKSSAAQAYPHYPACKSQFAREWTRFESFLTRERLAVPTVVQCEVTYVNHLVFGKEWSAFGDLNRILAPWSGVMTDGFLPSPEAGAVTLRYLMPDQNGRLHVVLQRAIRHTDGKNILQMTLTARGAPKTGSAGDVSAWMDLGREWVVRGFADLTSAEMHAQWRRMR